MFLKASTLALGSVLALATLQPASAHWWSRDIQNDVNAVHQDRNTVANDERRLAQERAEYNAANSREHRALEHGNFFGAFRFWEQKKRESSELAAANDKLRADRAKLAHDRRDLHEDFERRY